MDPPLVLAIIQFHDPRDVKAQLEHSWVMGGYSCSFSSACAAVQTGFREDLFGCVSPGRSVHRLSDGRLSLQPRCLSGTADP
ncbi:hypothetical protein F7725_013564 [Dissostichus mawsoni]|uniref:Uncharacterized protein n=1 Tax=Dissostichus mawsoni TaxID=36200 RepID=A0A7J5Y540_DISMA|nr:hypothetical protein F7725_013564 [Dissostichus mawsoni]